MIDIKPLKGLGCLNFGMSTQEIIKIIGEPDAKDNNEDENILSFIYNKYEIVFQFEYLKDLKLGWIMISNEYASFDQKYILGQDINYILFLCENVFGEKAQKEDNGNFESYYFQENVFELLVEYQKVVQVNFGDKI